MPKKGKCTGLTALGAPCGLPTPPGKDLCKAHWQQWMRDRKRAINRERRAHHWYANRATSPDHG